MDLREGCPELKTLYLSIIFMILLCGTIPAWAYVGLDAYLPISGDPVTPDFKFDKTYKIDYPNGGKLKDALDGWNLTVTCFGNSSSSQSVKQLMESINSQILSSKSAVSITNLDLFYMFSLRGTPTYAAMDYLLVLRPTITGYLINDGHGKTPSTLDASWMGFAINNPLVIDAKNCRNMVINHPAEIDAKNYEDLEINYPLNTTKSILPDVYNVIYNTPGEEIFDQAFNQNLIDSTPLLQIPLDKWDSLYDPAYTLTDTAEPSLSKGEKAGATAFSTGLDLASSVPSQPNNIGTDFVADTKYHLSKIDHPYASGTINVEGHANTNQIQGGWTFITMTPVSTCCPYPVHWYDNVPSLAWIGLGVGAVIGFCIFYFRRFKE
ncbi:MAG: hypothetical protein KGI33_09145 [Thaumarchaeota archaeon]|nr:hypothetical protein [Nitrososphaerota archaeon]